MPSTKQVVAGVAVVVGLLAVVAFLIFSQPSVSGIDSRFAGVNETETVVESELAVRNPNPIGANLGGSRSITPST
jgi:LEA14-like dessication related protein